ncbi:MAG: ParB/RepB/Spo0J family partition protein, partial [Planctomycetota bacterium]
MAQTSATTQQTPAKRPRRLGKGLSSLLGDPVAAAGPAPQPASQEEGRSTGSSAPAPGSAADPATAQDAQTLLQLDPEDIAPNPYQPRKTFDEEALAQLARSIREQGLLQPLVVQRAPAGEDKPWRLVAGERRLRAARLAGLDRIPAIQADVADQRSAELALLENLQREDLLPMERAHGLRRLRDQFQLTQQELADRLGLSRSVVANAIRLTELEASIQQLLDEGALSEGHAKVLLGAPPGKTRERLAQEAVEQGLSVRALERALRRTLRSGSEAATPEPGAFTTPSARAAACADASRRLSEAL